MDFDQLASLALEGDFCAISEVIERADAAKRALEAADRLFREALPKFNWGASSLDGGAIELLNEVPQTVRHAISLLE